MRRYKIFGGRSEGKDDDDGDAEAAAEATEEDTNDGDGIFFGDNTFTCI